MRHVLGRHEGPAFFTALQALVKGTLESDVSVELIACPDSHPFQDMTSMVREIGVSEILQQHDLHVRGVAHAGRGVDLGVAMASRGGACLALVPADQLAETEPAIERAAFSNQSAGCMTIVIEDDQRRSTGVCPRLLARQLGLPCLEASTVEDLRDSIEWSLRLARAGGGVACLTVHRDIWRAADTLTVRPNRIGDSIDATIARRYRRTTRPAEANDVLQLARRLELNRLYRLPSPGEREPIGFILTGPAAEAMNHLLFVLHMKGRVPLLHLRLTHPIDESMVQRLLSRCEQIMVIEARPGSVESEVLAVVEKMRNREREHPASVLSCDHGVSQSGLLQSAESIGHPSILARRLKSSLRLVRSASEIDDRLASLPDAPVDRVAGRHESVGIHAAEKQLRSLIDDLRKWSSDHGRSESGETTWVGLTGESAPAGADRIVRAEIWSATRLLRDGWSIVRDTSQETPFLLLVCAVDGEDVYEFERFSRGIIPTDSPASVRVESGEFAQRQRLREQLRQAAMTEAVTIMIIRDGQPAQYDVRRVEREMAESDRLGFEPRQRLIWSVDQTCAIRLPDDEQLLDRAQQRDPGLMEPEFSIDRLPEGVDQRFRLRLRPMFEQVDVIRSRPPLALWRQQAPERLAVSKPVHAGQSVWRMHVAGYRGGTNGVLWRVLCRAGRHMGYLVRTLTDETPIGAGRRAWMQVLFTRPHGSEFATSESAHLPFGEADLLLGLDWDETLRALGPDKQLRVAHPLRTAGVINSGFFDDERETNRIRLQRQQQRLAVERVVTSETSRIDDFVDAARLTFHSDRQTDLVMLGLAFQRGLVPLSLDALELSLQELESNGFGLSREAFEFGRHLAVQRDLMKRPRIDAVGDVDRLCQRLLLTVRRSGPGGRRRTKRFRQLLERTLTLTPGLSETDAGRIVRRDMVLGLYRTMLWGGLDYAGIYADSIIRLYEADRGETGRAVTRYMVLPIADAMLIRDALYIATLASSPEQRRRIRQRLMVKLARGDELERRYLTRFELTGFNRRIRADIRTSDWPARVIAMGRHLIPQRWRGTASDRQFRDEVVELVGRMARNLHHDYEHWLHIARRLHDRAAQNQLRSGTSGLDSIEAGAQEPGLSNTSNVKIDEAASTT